MRSELSLPPPVAHLIETLEAAGHAAHLVGSAVRELLGGLPVADFEIATSAPHEVVLALFPGAVPTRPEVCMVPTAAGPADVLPYAHGDSIEAELAHRDFTLHAVAVSVSGEVLDPFDGCADAVKGLLRSVGPASERLAEDPLRALRAARLVATRDLEVDPGLAAALPAFASRMAAVPACRVREELRLLILGRHAGRGLALLRESGLEEVLAPGVPPDAAAVVAALPFDLELRLAGWLRGTRAVSILRRLRVPRPRTVAVERLLQLHPVDASSPQPETRIRRLARRSEVLLDRLFALREAEIAAGGAEPGARERLARLRDEVARALRSEAPKAAPLALDGRAVMEALGCGPGPHVGRAKRYLAEVVRAEPHANDPATLRARLLAWWKASGRGSGD